MRRILLFLSLLCLLPTLATAETVTTEIQGFSDSGLSGGTTKVIDCDFTPNTGSEVWHIKSTEKVYAKSNDGGRAHVGSANSKFNGQVSLTKTQIPSDAVITNIQLKVYLAKNSQIYTVTPTVNGSAYCDAKLLQGDPSAAKDVTFDFSGNAVGNEIVLEFSSTSNGYVHFAEISVTYEADGDVSSVTKFEVPAIAVDYDAKQFTVTPAANTTESYKLWYCVTDTEALPENPDWQEYTAPVALADDYNLHYVHAYAESLDAEKYANSDVATNSYQQKDPNSTTYVETIDVNVLSLDSSKTAYQSGSWTSPETKVTYTYKVAYNGGNMQFNNSSSDKGIWVTANPNNYRVASVEVVWGSSSNEFDVYGKAEAYSGASDLYSKTKATQGTLIKGFTASGVQDVTDEYTFLGFRSKSGVIYIESIKITYEIGPKEPEVYEGTFNDYVMTVGETQTIEVAEKHPEIAYTVTEGAEVISIADGVITANAKGVAKVTASWTDSADWVAGTADFTVTVKAAAIKLAAPVINMTEDGYTITKTDESGTIMYVEKKKGETPADADYQAYEAFVAKNTQSGTYVVYAYVKADADDEEHLDSDEVTAEYEVLPEPEPLGESIVIPFNSDTFGITDSSYVTSEFEFELQGYLFAANNVNPSTGQVRGNSSSAANFYFYNKTPLPKIKKIVVTFDTDKSSNMGSWKADYILFNESSAMLNTVPENNEGYEMGTLETAVLTWTPETVEDFMRMQFFPGGSFAKCCISNIEIFFDSSKMVPEVELYQLVKDESKDNAYVTYKKGAAKQYDVTLDADGNVATFVERTADDVFDYGTANAKWTAKVACMTSVPADYVASEAETKVIDNFAVCYGDEVVADFTAQAKENVEAVYGAVKEFNTLTDFMNDWTVKFDASITEENANEATEVSEVSEAAKLALTMPVYSVEDVTFAVKNDITGDVAVNDELTGETHTHSVNDALVNELDVNININTPNVEEGLLAALNAECVADVLKIEGAEYNVTYDTTADKVVTIANEDPNNWLDENWQPVEKTVSLDSHFTNADLQVYEAGEPVKARMSAVPLSVTMPKMSAVRAKVIVDEPADGNNVYKEALYLVKTNIDLQGAARSSIKGVTLNSGNNAEYVLLQADGKTIKSDYVSLTDSKEVAVESSNSGNCYHKFAELEDEASMVKIAESEKSFNWYGNMDSDIYITNNPKIGFTVADFFTGNTTMSGKGLTLEQPAAAPAAETATHYVLYPPMQEVEVEYDIVTAVEEVEVANEWIKVGAGSFEVVANGVMVFDLNGVMIADAQGRYNVPAGIYLAVYGKQAVKVVVK